LIDSSIKLELVHELESLEQNLRIRPKGHYDLFQADMYCYMKEVTPYPCEGESCWLPSQFQVTKLEEKKYQVHINSYINNVDQRRHSKLYTLLEQVFERAIPDVTRIVPSLFLKQNEETLKVIVRTCNSTNPPYTGHIASEEFLNENWSTTPIVATVMFCYQLENIENLHLDFREIIDEYEGTKNGLEYGDLLTNYLGTFPIRKDRLLVLSELVEHRLRHFYPIEPSDKSVYKFLLFHIIEPSYNMPTTDTVEIQRKDMAISKCLCLASLIPFHVILLIVDFFPLVSQQTAKNFAQLLREYRKSSILQSNEDCHTYRGF